jgi:hypothetical protein
MIKKSVVFLIPLLVQLLIVSRAGAQSPATAQTPVLPPPPVTGKSVFPHWFLGLSAGPAFPAGKFGDKKYPDPQAGYAHTGIGAEIDLGYRINRSFSVVLAVEGQTNGTDEAARKNFVHPTNGSYPAVVYTYHSYNWKMARFLAGGVYTRSLSAHGNLALQLRFLAGILMTGVPGYSATLYNSSNNSLTSAGNVADASLPWTFCYQGDAGLKFRLTHVLWLVANTGYAAANPAGHNFSFPFPTGNPQPLHSTSTFHTGTIHVRTGIELNL